jgi:cyclic pyranopterin phosphate synthase
MAAHRHGYNLIRRTAGKVLRNSPGIKEWLAQTGVWVDLFKHDIALRYPEIIQPRPYMLMVAVTGRCNARCIGCRYGRDFMVGHQLDWATMEALLDDAKDAGFYTIRLYGGEPLLHPDLPRMVSGCLERGIKPFVTTNAILLDERKMATLYEAGLRDVSLGLYGVGESYDRYACHPGAFERIERNIRSIREHYGDEIEIIASWLLKRPNCNVQALREAWEFAVRYNIILQIDLVHYSLPYFTEGPEKVLQFRPEDRDSIIQVVDELQILKAKDPHRLRMSVEGIRSIPEWLLKGPEMKIPCVAYDMIWIGPDGTVQLCYTTFKLGNLHEMRLSEILFTENHRDAARRAFQLDCPNCHCGAEARILRHRPSRTRFAST